jgi:hypothetical protein
VIMRYWKRQLLPLPRSVRGVNAITRDWVRRGNPNVRVPRLQASLTVLLWNLPLRAKLGPRIVSRCFPSFVCTHPLFIGSDVPTPLVEGTLDYPVDASHSHSEDNQTVDGTMFNATDVTQPPFNVHAFQGAQASHIDPATTYLPGYGTFVSRKYVKPLELRLQDSPAAEPGDGTSFLTVYTLNKQYGFSRTQPARAAGPANSVALKCANLPKLIPTWCREGDSEARRSNLVSHMSDSKRKIKTVEIFTCIESDRTC